MRNQAAPGVSAAVTAVVLVASGCTGASGTSTASVPRVAAPAAADAPADPRVGAVFPGGGSMHSCTGSVVDSPDGDLVLTAAHCLAGGVPATFVPDMSADTIPSAADIWQVEAVYLDPRWLATQDPQADYAFARVERSSGGSIRDAAGGSLAIGATPKAGTTVTVTGYPAGEGGGPITCRGVTELVDGYPSLRCGGLVDGTSGAPWMAGNTVIAVTGGRDGGGCDGDVSYSSPFDGHVTALLARAEAAGPGDDPPDAYASDC